MDRVIRQLVSVLAVYAAIGFLALGTGVSASAATLTTSVTACDSPASVAQVSANGARLAALTGPVREGSSPTVGTSAGRSDFAVAAEETAAGTRSVDEVLNGLPRGKQGFVRTVPDEATLQSTFEELTQGGTPTTWKGYGGDVFELPDGTQIGLRGTSRSGGSTIDLRIPGQDPFRIHIG